ncbi:MAG: hypothetical protein IPL16_16440 [Ignavibacteria bacterium]|nr:hypothetical protein [Ignavibacteria bacterium]MBL0107810.1 hypothetical protein [Ignavibacteria bacterium]
MKIIYVLLYCLSGIMFLTAILGSSLTEPVFNRISERTMETAGFKKSYFQSADDRIDDLVYKSRQIELQIEKIKNFFSSEKIDESKYSREKTSLLEKTFYNPLIGLFNVIFRTGLIFISFLMLSFAVIFHLAYRGSELRKRVRKLEEIVFAKNYVREY